MTQLLEDELSLSEERPGPAVIAVALVTAACCLGFAVFNLWFEATGFLAVGPNAAYAEAFTVLNWLVVALKVIGAAAALGSVSGRPRGPLQRLLGLTLWGAFGTLAIYSLGSVGQAVALLLGYLGGPGRLTPEALAYVLFFLLLATGFGVLAVSYRRRFRLRRWIPVLGFTAGPLVLLVVLLAVPALLAALGVMPSV
ncbi:hypothetical protein [Granulicoccus phenolivorans]|uniref:hypothetical protein n=1 Tax=Granulicoccus phenolivorans TaxID=266854 RepID=UPI00041C1167|nr:hypothetical protein [Granulicoccus phenolivorans]